MKVLTYNIMEGGVKNGAHQSDPSRLEKVLKVIGEQDADVFGLQETELTNGDENKLVSALSRRGYHPYNINFSNDERPQFQDATTGTALFSKRAPSSTWMGNGVKAVEMTFRPLFTGSLSICSVYLSHISEATRLPQITEVLEKLRGEKYSILVGDFNALSPEDSIQDNVVDHFSDKMKRKYCRDGKLCYDTVESVLKEGYVDVGLQYHSPTEITDRTDLPGPTSGGGHTMPIRMDYIFAKPEVLPHITEFVLVNQSLARTASDHFPWYITLDFSLF